MIKKATKWFCGVLAAMMLVVCVPAASAIDAAPETKANNVMVASVNTGAIIYEKNADEQIYPASTTKLMTMAVAIDLIPDLSATMTFDKGAAYADLVIGSSNMGLKDEEVVVLNDLMYGIAISSANEATNAIAIHLCGSIEAFVAKMNERAAEWGMTNTHFANTHGLTDENHYTTARDMMKLAQKVFADERLTPYLSASSYRLPATNKNAERTLITTNQLIRMNSENYYKYAVAGKTGSTTAAGYNLISTAKYKGMEYICLTMNAPYEEKPNPVFAESIALYKWAFTNFGVQTLLTESTSVCEIAVALCAKSDYVMLVPEKKIEAVVANDVEIDSFERVINTEYNEDNPALAPIAVGDVLGSVTLVKDGVEYGTVNLVASTELERSNILYYLYLIRTFFSNTIVRIVTVILILAIIAYIIFMIWQNNHRRRSKIARRIRF
ncbi:MAG: D-alanyl-D-alanine carboxypeptidase [Clostridia bacterium]|nr:D-alanyl-D-alanine carboxypeptidase [Clostridia bacterium]